MKQVASSLEARIVLNFDRPASGCEVGAPNVREPRPEAKSSTSSVHFALIRRRKLCCVPASLSR